MRERKCSGRLGSTSGEGGTTPRRPGLTPVLGVSVIFISNFIKLKTRKRRCSLKLDFVPI